MSHRRALLAVPSRPRCRANSRRDPRRVAGTQVRAVDPPARTAETEAGRLSYDVLSVIPPNRTMPFITDAGLGAPFVDVDPKSFRSTRDERIYAVGDNADTPYAKTG